MPGLFTNGVLKKPGLEGRGKGSVGDRNADGGGGSDQTVFFWVKKWVPARLRKRTGVGGGAGRREGDFLGGDQCPGTWIGGP